MDELLCKEYSPSQWSSRVAADKIVQLHGDVMKSFSDLAYEKLSHLSVNLNDSTDSSWSKERCLEIFYKNHESFSYDQSADKLNFNGRKVFIYLHGGYWQWGSVYWSSFMAQNLIDNDIVLVAVGHEIAPNVSMTQIVSQVEHGIAKVLANSNGSQVFICGHSAGAHLASMMLHTDFSKYGVSRSKSGLNGLVLVSGVFDLKPLIATDINDNLKMDLDEAIRLSPALKDETIFFNDIERSVMKVLLVYGQFESGSFKKQSEDYANHLRIKLKIGSVVCHEIENVDHFNIIEDIRLRDYSLTREIIHLLNGN